MSAYHLPHCAPCGWTFSNVAAIANNVRWCFIHRAPPVALLLTNLQMTHWFLQTKQIARRGSLQCDSEGKLITQHLYCCAWTSSFYFRRSQCDGNVREMSAGACQRCPSPRWGADTCPRSAVLATLDRTWLINRPVLIAGTPLRGEGPAVTWIPRRGDSKSRGKCNGFCKNCHTLR